MEQNRSATGDALRRSRAPCHFFLAGNCRSGENCRFSHGQAAESHGATRNGRLNAPCKYFARGGCQRGEACHFTHDPYTIQTPGANLPVETTDVAGDGRPSLPCKYFALGSCNKGETCLFLHDANADRNPGENSANGGDLDSTLDDYDSKDDFTRPISGGVVQYGNGATIEKISLNTDFSSVRLINLPPNSTKEWVQNLLARVGVGISLNSIRVYTNKSIADLRVEDPQFANSVSSRLLPAARGDIQVAHFSTALSTPGPGSADRRSTTKKVHITWYRPTRTVWLKFRNRRLAQVTKTFFDSGEYTILGEEIRASRATGSQDRSDPDYTLWTVELTSVPAEVTKAIVQDIFDPELVPDDIALSKASYTVTDNAAGAAVISMLTAVGPVEWFKTNACSGGKRMRAVACFTSESDAREAAGALNDVRAPFSQHIKLAIDLAHSTKFKFLARIYDVAARKIETLKSKWEKLHVHVYDYPPEGKFKSLKIEGRQIQEVARAAAELESIISGQIAENEKGALWSPSLARNGVLLQKVKDIEEEIGVVVIRDTRKCQLRVIGPAAKRADAVRLIANVLKEDTASEFAIELTPRQYEWARRGGFRAVSAELGRNIAKFDILSQPKRILIVGTDIDLYYAKVLVDEGNEPPELASDGNDCSVCLCEAEEPVVTTCGHQYCSECFENLAHDGASSASQVECKGADDTCNALISPDDLRINLSSSAFEDVLSASFKSYVASHPLEYRHCSTPDCPQIFRVGTSGVHACSECMTTTCKKCGEAHDGMSCEEKKEYNSEDQQLLRKVKLELDIKDCPKCKTAIEKTDGCNHMTCAACHTDICWVCLKTFSNSQGCYDHLYETHGGIH